MFFLVVMQFCAGCWKNSYQRNVIWILWVLLDWCRTSAIRAVKSSKGQFDIYKMPGKLCMKQSAFYLHLCTVGGISIRSVRICSVSDFFKHCSSSPNLKTLWTLTNLKRWNIATQTIFGYEWEKKKQMCKLCFSLTLSVHRVFPTLRTCVAIPCKYFAFWEFLDWKLYV